VLSRFLFGLLLSLSTITSSGIPSFPEDPFFWSFSYLRDLIS
jgi:H+/gluconate symporter-like permease